jgi:YhcH/YjgK/YiaL family protein
MINYTSMKTISVLLSALMMTICISCSNKPKDQKFRNEAQMNEWFTKGEWKSGWEVIPDESVNRKEFARHYFGTSERWEKAFNFLRSNDLSKLDIGRYQLEGDSLFVNVSEYTTLNEEDTRFEAHQKYADIQYLVFGEEKIGIVPLAESTVTEPYNPEKDAAFLTCSENHYRLASPERFFVFFPDDAHRPGVKNTGNMLVRKIVVKVLIE